MQCPDTHILNFHVVMNVDASDIKWHVIPTSTWGMQHQLMTHPPPNLAGPEGSSGVFLERNSDCAEVGNLKFRSVLVADPVQMLSVMMVMHHRSTQQHVLEGEKPTCVRTTTYLKVWAHRPGCCGMFLYNNKPHGKVVERFMQHTVSVCVETNNVTRVT